MDPARQAAQIEDFVAQRVSAQHPKTIGRTAIERVGRSLDGQAVPPLVAVDVGLVDHETLGGKLNDD
jgi:ABC-type sugar transport system substrate-binding protein